jgi:DUF1707 SHOCT-like domain
MQPSAEPDPGQERQGQPPTPRAAGPGSAPERVPGSSALESAAAPAAPPLRASDRERDAAVQRLQSAFTEGRIDDQEFDERMRAALTARARAELDQLLADLPRSGELASAPTQSGGSTTITAVAYKGRVEIVVPPGVRVHVRGHSYGGHWADEVPDHDLPADAPVVHVRAVAYKGVVEARPTPTPGGQITRR